MRADPELARGGIGVGKIAQVAPQRQVDVARAARHDRPGDPFARLLAHQAAERQVARDLAAVGARQARPQIDRPGAAAVAPRVGAGRIAREVLAGEAQRRDPHVDRARLRMCPVDLPVEPVELDAPLRKNLRQIELGLARGEVDAAAAGAGPGLGPRRLRQRLSGRPAVAA